MPWRTSCKAPFILRVFVAACSFAGGATGSLKGKVLCYGDSLTAGLYGQWQFHPYARHLQKLLGESYKVDWIGLTGFATRQFLASVNESDTADFFGIKHFPGLRRKLREGGGFDLAIVMAGTNDIRRGRLAGDILRNLRKLYAVFKEEGVRQILALGVPDSANVWNADDRRVTLNLSLRALALFDPSVRYLKPPVSYVRGDPYEWDGLHFSWRTSELLAERLLPVVRQMLATLPKTAKKRT